MSLFRLASPWPLLAFLFESRAFSPRALLRLQQPGKMVQLQHLNVGPSSSSCCCCCGTFNPPITRLYDSAFQDDLVEKQKKVSLQNKNGTDQDTSTSAAAAAAVENHLEHQQAVFDDMSDFFNSEVATPPEVEPVLDYIVKKALRQSIQTGCEKEQQEHIKVMDVGCGTGALFPSYIKAADELGIVLDITGIDLSTKMTKFAIQNAKKLEQQSGGRHLINCCEAGDFVGRVMGMNPCAESIIGYDYGSIQGTEDLRGVFDVCVINACFGNFLDLDSVVTAASTCLKVGGVFVVSHPLGAPFVEKLHEESPETVPNFLPSRQQFAEMLTYQPLKMLEFEEEVQIPQDASSKDVMYYASAVKTPYRMLRSIIRLRGVVDQGYGRGGKKLGFPTANLPSSLFADALMDVPTGVYMGYAVIETSNEVGKKGRGIMHKAVVNVGYSPTFDGSENKEKIVEAHLIVEKGAIEGDFYGETMRLALSGFLRPEMKFPSFSDLIQAITNDVKNAKDSLDIYPYITFAEVDPFLKDHQEKWIGGSGGDEVASYEFENTNKFCMEMELE